MAHNFRKHLQPDFSGSVPCLFFSKSGTGNGQTPDTASSNWGQVASYSTIAANPSGTDSGANWGDPSSIIVGAGQYTGPFITTNRNIIADGKVVWNLNNAVIFYGNSDQDSGRNRTMYGMDMRFALGLRATGIAGGRAVGINYNRCIFRFIDNSSRNITHCAYDENPIPPTTYLGEYGKMNDCILYKPNGYRLDINRCLVFSARLTSLRKFANSYSDPASFISLQSADAITNVNIQGQIRVDNDSFGYTDIDTFKQNYGLNSRLDIIGKAPRFNKPASEDYTLKLDSPHLDLQVGPSHLRFALMYYVDSSVSPGDPCTMANTRLKNTADNSLVQFKEIGGFTINSSGGLVISPNSQGNFEGYYTTSRMQMAATNQRIKLIPVISGLNFDSDFPATAAAFSSVSPEVFNNNVPDYSNSSSNGARTPNRLTVQARFSTLANPDENTNEHWVPSNGQFLDFEIDEEPLYDSVTGYGSGHPLFDPLSTNVRPILARFLQVRYKSRNDYYSK